MDSPSVGGPPTALPALSQSLPIRLMRAREAVMARLRPLLRAHNLTEQQWRVLRILHDMHELEITTLAARVFLLPPSLSRILRDLEARDLVLRRASLDDQRRSLVSLAPQGTALILRTAPVFVEVIAQMRVMYGFERLAALERLLIELEEALSLPDKETAS